MQPATDARSTSLEHDGHTRRKLDALSVGEAQHPERHVRKLIQQSRRRSSILYHESISSTDSAIADSGRVGGTRRRSSASCRGSGRASFPLPPDTPQIILMYVSSASQHFGTMSPGHAAEALVVIQHRVHVLNPDCIHRTIEVHPLPENQTHMRTSVPRLMSLSRLQSA